MPDEEAPRDPQCPHCGTGLVEKWIVHSVRNIGSVDESQQMDCPECGQDMTDTS